MQKNQGDRSHDYMILYLNLLIHNLSLSLIRTIMRVTLQYLTLKRFMPVSADT